MEDPAGVDAVRTCGTMRHHDEIIILPLPRLSSTVAADLVLAIRGIIRAAKVPAQMALRLSFNSERAGTITIGGMPRSAERYRRSFAARSPSAPAMEVFPGLEEGYMKKGRSLANLAGTGPGLYGGGNPPRRGSRCHPPSGRFRHSSPGHRFRSAYPRTGLCRQGPA